MKKIIIVMETDVSNNSGVEKLRNVMDAQSSVRGWTIDMDDDQKVLRIISGKDISRKVTMDLRREGISAAIMEVF